MKNSDLWRAIVCGAYYGLGINVVTRLFENVVAFNLALLLSMLVLSFIAYPLFARGRVNNWTKDKRPWTFPSFMIVMLAIAISMFVAATFLLSDITS